MLNLTKEVRRDLIKAMLKVIKTGATHSLKLEINKEEVTFKPGKYTTSIIELNTKGNKEYTLYSTTEFVMQSCGTLIETINKEADKITIKDVEALDFKEDIFLRLVEESIVKDIKDIENYYSMLQHNGVEDIKSLYLTIGEIIKIADTLNIEEVKNTPYNVMQRNLGNLDSLEVEKLYPYSIRHIERQARTKNKQESIYIERLNSDGTIHKLLMVKLQAKNSNMITISSPLYETNFYYIGDSSLDDIIMRPNTLMNEYTTQWGIALKDKSAEEDNRLRVLAPYDEDYLLDEGKLVDNLRSRGREIIVNNIPKMSEAVYNETSLAYQLKGTKDYSLIHYSMFEYVGAIEYYASTMLDTETLEEDELPHYLSTKIVNTMALMLTKGIC